jgi:hypothetical protein
VGLTSLCAALAELCDLEVVLVEGCGRRAFVQPLDMAGMAEQVVFQRVAAVTIFIIELQTTVLGEKQECSVETKQNRPRR